MCGVNKVDFSGRPYLAIVPLGGVTTSARPHRRDASRVQLRLGVDLSRAAYEHELTALGVLSRLAKERGVLIGKPFELADAQALLRLLEVALPTVVAKLTQRAEDLLKVTDADEGEDPKERYT